ncbi:tRNA dihydrouridine synthase [Patescibacteria group bacterium]
MTFWKELQKKKNPFFALAPMADVTDVAFREMFARYGSPDVFWTEFVACDGLTHPEGKKALLRDLEYTEAQRPIVAQIFGGKPENFYESAKIIAELGFDGIDINMGCPHKIIEKQGAGASLMKNPELAVKIIEATQKGIEDSCKNIPLSVKTRIGYNKNEIEDWIPILLNTGIYALTVHTRTRKEMSDVPARWEHVKRVVEIRDELGSDAVIIGNGDVESLEDGKEKAKESGADGVMVGRAVFGTPWFFGDQITELNDRLKIMVEHTKLFEEKLGDVKNFALMKKHYKAYVQGFDGAKELRIELMDAKNADEVEGIVDKFLHKK